MAAKNGISMLDRSRQVAVQVHEILRKRILTVELAPGAMLSRAALQEEFGVSVTPVRDALLRLQEDGLVEIYPQYATRVSRIDVDHARQAQFLRLSVEIEAVRRLVEESPRETAAALGAILQMQVRYAELKADDRFDVLDREFHRVLYVRSRNPHLWDVIREKSVHLDRLRRLNLPMPGKMQSLLAQHREIVQAIRQEDAQAAVAALRRHLSGTLSAIDAIHTRFPDFIHDEGREGHSRTGDVDG